MPVIKSAIKKLRQDRKKTVHNNGLRRKLKAAIMKARKDSSKDTLEEAFSVIDKSAKHNIIHKNKAAHIKSSLSKVKSGTSLVSGPKTNSGTKAKKSPPKPKK